MMASFQRRLLRIPYPQLTAEIIEETGYRKLLLEEGTEQARDRLQNLEELLKGMEEHCSTAGTLQEYLEQIALVTDLDAYDTSFDRVTLMTLHAAKGLEFPLVFMTGMEEGLFPHSRTSDEKDDIEEERRLCYVGMTRAMEKLYFTCARRRRVYGSFQFNPPSRFLDEVPTHLLARIDLPALHRPAAHNLASVFGQMSPCFSEEEKPSFAEEVRIVPEADEGLRIGSRVRHISFGIGTVRRLEGHGDNRKVTVYFSTVGSKKLLLKFAGLEPA
jgi:DNA helicase-2/ATP-dependent DNA helicase PcrA